MRSLLVLGVLIALFGCQGNQVAKTASKSVEPFKVLAKGEPIDLNPHVVQGQVTVFEVYADWCAPCKAVERSLIDLKKVYGDRLTVFKLDLVDWKSELAKQRGIRDLPYLIIFDRQGELLVEGPSNVTLPKLVAALNQSNS